jgi:hypothetical protein
VKVLVVVLVLTALWMVLGAVLGGCSSRRAARELDGVAGEAWLWESLDRHARLAGAAALPASHPLARIPLASRAPIR